MCLSYHINDLLPLGLDLPGLWLQRTFTKTLQLCLASDEFYHRRFLREKACIPQFDGGSQHITCLGDGYVELDNCRGSDCDAQDCLNVCGGPCDASNSTCATMTQSFEDGSSPLTIYERSQCVSNVVLPDMPPGASSDFEISGQFDAVGTVESVSMIDSGAQGLGREGGLIVLVLVFFAV